MKNCNTGHVSDLLHKESSRSVRQKRTLPPWRGGWTSGLSLEGSGPCVLTRDPMYTNGPGTHDGVSIWHRRSRPVRAGRATASNLDTHLDRGVGRSVRMLLSFQRPSHLFGRGFLPGARPKSCPIPERTGEYSARTPMRRDAAALDDRHRPAPRAVAPPLSAGSWAGLRANPGRAGKSGGRERRIPGRARQIRGSRAANPGPRGNPRPRR